MLLLSFGFRVVFALLSSPIGWILIGAGLYYLWKKQPRDQRPMEYEVIEDEVIVNVPDDDTVFPDEKNS